MSSAPASAGAGEIAAEASRRRTFAIISHPDAGKTTLTEKLLLYGGAVVEAGSVDGGRRGRRASRSDWMGIERQRGISVTSTVLRFEYRDTVLNLLDTPGHRDFSEDTLRVLAAADSAVMLLDAARGVEAQTHRLFEVARARKIPLFTFINKYDRPGMDPLAMLDHISDTLGLQTDPLSWPVGIPGDFRGVVDRGTGTFHRFTRTARGAMPAAQEQMDPDRARKVEGDAWEAAAEELELLDAVGSELRRGDTDTGNVTPVLFGSAISNFGVELLLRTLLERAPSPGPRPVKDGGERGVDAPFSALVFKVQANMDPRHRDHVAFLRINSGRFERGMQAVNARTGRPFAMAHAHEVLGDDRTIIDIAYPGDIIGVVNASDLRVGDTLYLGERVEFPPIPTLAPEHFRRAHNRDSSRHKQFHRGLSQLAQEGVVHLLRRDPDADPTPVLAAVGPLQFEVVVARLRDEFGVEVALDETSWKLARRIDPDAADVVTRARHADLMHRSDGTMLALFTSDLMLEFFRRDNPEIELEQLLVR